jgi:hypothetical protein
MPTIWIESEKQREEVTWALVSNGYEVRQVEHPNKDWPKLLKIMALNIKKLSRRINEKEQSEGSAKEGL